MLRFMQGVTGLGLIVALCLVVIFTDLSVPDLFAGILAFIPTGWCIICVSYHILGVLNLFKELKACLAKLILDYKLWFLNLWIKSG